MKPTNTAAFDSLIRYCESLAFAKTCWTLTPLLFNPQEFVTLVRLQGLVAERLNTVMVVKEADQVVSLSVAARTSTG
jgi:hypothetical protein